MRKYVETKSVSVYKKDQARLLKSSPVPKETLRKLHCVGKGERI